MKKLNISADTPLSALFHDGCHDQLVNDIKYLCDFLIDCQSDVDVLKVSRFDLVSRFDFDFSSPKFRPCKVYQKLANMVNRHLLIVSHRELSRYMAEHSNLHASAESIYRSIYKYM